MWWYLLWEKHNTNRARGRERRCSIGSRKIKEIVSFLIEFEWMNCEVILAFNWAWDWYSQCSGVMQTKRNKFNNIYLVCVPLGYLVEKIERKMNWNWRRNKYEMRNNSKKFIKIYVYDFMRLYAALFSALLLHTFRYRTLYEAFS